MGRASFRERSAPASKGTPQSISYAEHQRILTEVTQSYERKLLALRKELGGELPAAAAEPAASEAVRSSDGTTWSEKSDESVPEEDASGDTPDSPGSERATRTRRGRPRGK